MATNEDTTNLNSDELPLQRSCGATASYYRQLEIDPDFGQNQRRLEIFTAQTRMFGDARGLLSVIKIPVAVHIVYNTADQNITDAQVKSQIKVLNQDFRAKNPDKSKVPAVWKPLIADAGIEFELLPDASLAITRTQTDVQWFGINERVKFTAEGGHDVYQSDRVLNIWVCNLRGLLGYAQFPGGKPETDGVVINFQAFGKNGSAKAPYNLGRTATHEIAHWLNLRHIWGDTQDCTGTDFVDDTPKAMLPNYRKPTFPHISCNNAPDGDMFVNFMDYVDDAAMFMFTRGQVDRMAATFLSLRPGFAS